MGLMLPWCSYYSDIRGNAPAFNTILSLHVTIRISLLIMLKVYIHLVRTGVGKQIPYTRGTSTYTGK